MVDKWNKPPDYDVLLRAWEALIQRFSDTVRHRNFPGPANPDEHGLILPDQTDVKGVTTLLRRMRRWNPVPHRVQYGPGYRNVLVDNLVEDPYFKSSDHSYFVQSCDCVAYFLYQELAPNAYARKRGARTYFQRVNPVLCTHASRTDPRGIVRL